MKRYDIIALLLVIYLAVMAYFGRGMLLSGNYWEYFSIIRSEERRGRERV